MGPKHDVEISELEREQMANQKMLEEELMSRPDLQASFHEFAAQEHKAGTFLKGADVPAAATAAAIKMPKKKVVHGQRERTRDVTGGKAPPKPTMQIKSRQPLMLRWWVPYVCFGGVVFVWIPDIYKVRALYRLEDWHQRCQYNMHHMYWRWTMKPEDYALLCEQEASMDQGTVKKSNCPL